MKNQKEVLRNVFTKGKSLTTKQIQAMYNIASPSKVISRLRYEDGLDIRSLKKVNSKGDVTYKYTLATAPTAAYCASRPSKK